MSSVSHIEKPVVGYVVVTMALLAGIVTASAFGQVPTLPIQPSTETRLLPGHETSHSLRRWILGVRADATGTGYVIRHVEHHSAARKIGLEPGDRIVAVDGRQIGFIGHHRVSLSETLESCGGLDGHVRLLIQNRRNRRLVSINAILRNPSDHLGH